MEFIELNRTLRKLSQHRDESDDTESNRAFPIGERLGWHDLLEEYRLIVLSEAGSGKTAEIRHVAQSLRAQGKPAFFIRLEHIPKDFEDAFEVGSYESFEEWLASGEEGWILLDSIDEARLRHPRDFEYAIRKLGKRISVALNQTHIVITGRTTAWRPKTDLDCCIQHLAYKKAVKVSPDQQHVEDDVSKSSIQTKTKSEDENQPIFKFVALTDLTRDQITTFVEARGIEDSSVFLDAVERADAWLFTSRPQDLEELTEFWLDKKRIGTRLEIMRNSIDRRLRERDQDRADTHPFSLERARQGVKLLAAATTLVQNPTIRVPDGAENSKGIAVQSVLTDWDDREQATLLSRPIFDEAIYGTVRFHHRSVQEYLTAEWFAELLKRETSRRKIETLFFRNQYGLNIVVPKLRPVLPWLAILDEKISNRLQKVAPEILFEEGDPSQLPLDVRRYILYKVCAQVADGATGRSPDYSAVQRFANTDLTDDIRKLIQKYADNEDLTAFLLRMIWRGQLSGVLPEAMEVALKPTTEKYARIAAFRSVMAVGSDTDQEYIRESFLEEAPELKREWLAELIEGIQPTEKVAVWLLACLEKTEPEDRYAVDYLTERVTEFVSTADIELLPQLVSGFNRLLSLPPTVERRYCEVSEKFQWLMAPACKAVERLILVHHPISLELNALAILNKLSVARNYGINGFSEVKAEFSKLVPEWKELNRALFWFEIQQLRKGIDRKRGERLTGFWQASQPSSFWRFEVDDFDYVTEEISHQTLVDNQLVALSLAFNLYKMAERPPAWRTRLKKLVVDNAELSQQLNDYLKPPAQSQSLRRLKRQQNEWKRRDEAFQRRQEEHHADWKKFFEENLDKAQAALSSMPGTVTNPLLYLFKQTRDKKSGTGRWTEYNWKTLISEYGKEVAHFYRDSTVAFWRHYEPELRSEGAPPNKTPYAVIIGLVGLEIEAHETQNWPKNLSTNEVELACKYASFELNGFPTWFPKLFEIYPEIVCNFLIQEIQYELSIQNSVDIYYILSDVAWSGQWAWEQLAPSIYQLLKKEPEKLSNLDKLLKILQESTISDALIEKLASRKCRTLRKKPEHVARWFAVWVSVAPETAIVDLENRIAELTDTDKQTFFAMTFINSLSGNYTENTTSIRQAFKTPKHLKTLYLLMHKYIRCAEDIDRTRSGVYSPELRDHAQRARDNLLSLLNQIPGKEPFLALIEISRVHPDEKYRSWIRLLAKAKAEQDGDIEPWSLSQVIEFHEALERTPNNHKELAELAVLRFLDLKDDLEHGDSSVAAILQRVNQETEMRNFIGHQMREKAQRRYTIPQEEELADAKRPDLRFHGVGFDAPVPVELKLADNWSGSTLFERLENQLCGDYLRDNRSNRGIFVLVYMGDKTGWDLPNSRQRVDFAGLTTALQDHWWHISQRFPNVDRITVIGIDLTRRAS